MNWSRTVHIDDNHDLSKDILKYLIENPDGKDTLEGIARFWITSSRIDTLVDRIQAAVTALVEHGYLKENVMRDSSGRITERYYQVDTARMTEIITFLQRNIG